MKDVREVTRYGTRTESQESIARITQGLKLKADVTRSQKQGQQWPCKNDCIAVLNVKVFANANQTDFIIYSTGRFRYLIIDLQFITTPPIELLKFVRTEFITQKNPPQKQIDCPEGEE